MRAWSEQMGVWEEEDSEQRETRNMCFFEKKEFVFKTKRDSYLNTQVINTGMKEGEGLAIRMGWN